MMLKKLFIALFVAMTTVAITGCEQEGPVEEMAEDIDQAAEDTGEALEDAGEAVVEACEDATDKDCN